MSKLNMITIPRSALDALTEKLNTFNAGYGPYEIGFWTTTVIDREMTGVTFFFDDQRDGEYQQRYLIGEGGMARLP